MNLIRWSPWSPFHDLFDMQREWNPAVDVFTRDKDLVIRVEVPGIDPENDVDVTVHEGVLSIHGERRREKHTEGNGGYRFESSHGVFERRILLPGGVKEKDIKAEYDKGVLEIVVSKAAEQAEAKRIPVKVNGGRKALTTRGRNS